MPIINANFNPLQEFNEEWITKGIDLKGVNYLENLGFFLCEKRSERDNYPGRNAVTVSQIRNVFGEVKRIEANIDASENLDDWKQDFLFLRPKIAYAAARVISKNRNSRINIFKDVLEKAHHAVNDDKDNMKRFSKFFEAIVAYHKVYGGKE